MNRLRDNQIKALDAFKNHYYEKGNTRGLLSMCCGSGKSRTFYEIIKICMENDDNFFIYTTSRILLVESIIKDLLEWSYIEQLDINILIKVSDINIKSITNSIVKNLEKKNFDIDNLNNYFKKLLEKGKIRELSPSIYDIKDTLKNYFNDNKKIIIISTYESISKIYDSIQLNNDNEINKTKYITPSLVVADEAHNLVSENNNIKIAKKMLELDEDSLCNPEKFLFMTATPLKIIKRNRTSTFTDDNITYSMDNDDIYGKVFYEYTFYEGMKDKYILNFEIIYLNDLDNDLNYDFDEITNYDKDEQQILYFYSISKILLKVIHKFNLKHILVFMSNQSKVTDFNKILDEDIKENNYNIKTYKIISGDNKTNQKKNRREFEIFDGSSKILLSVDMLNEGIDIPICDSVFFAEERNSETVIVQNIGRALRIFEKTDDYVKDKAYIIIPTKIYSCGEQNTSYSSKFKKIREVCDIMREKPSFDPKYYKRTTKGNTKSFLNKNDEEDIDDKSAKIDDILQINENEIIDDKKNKKESILENIDNDKKEILEKEACKIVESFEIISTTNSLSNITYEQFKEQIQIAQINKLWDINKFLIDKCYPFEKPHIQFKKDWICYGHLLFNKIYTYDEASNIIKSIDLTNIESTLDWIDLYNNTINQALEANENLDIELLNKFIYIPLDPKTYYLDEWDNWSNFLGKELKNTSGIEINKNNSSSTTNALNNLTNLINNDKDKIKKIIALEWQSYTDIKLNITPIKDYINSFFGIKCLIDIRYRVTKTFFYQSLILNIKISSLPEYKILATLDTNYKLKYDKIIYDLTNIDNKDINRDQEHYINNPELRNIIDNIKLELKEYIDDYRNFSIIS
jgi:superfamily II DNA or RNA helicase